MCGHVFCDSCLVDWEADQEERLEKKTCPTYRREVKKLSEGLERLEVFL